MVSADEDIRFLIQIVQKDDEIQRKRKFLEIAPKKIKEIDGELNMMDEKMRVDQDELGALESEKRSLDGKVEIQNANITKKKLDRESLKTNKEYRAMGNEIEFLISQVDREEERILEILDQITGKKAELAEIQKKIDEVKDSLLEKKNVLEGEVKAEQEALKVLEDEKIRILPHLSDRVMRRYQRIQDAKGEWRLDGL